MKFFIYTVAVLFFAGCTEDKSAPLVTTGPGLFSSSDLDHLVVIPPIHGNPEFLLASLYDGLIRVETAEMSREKTLVEC